jgi:hypothetical protein
VLSSKDAINAIRRSLPTTAQFVVTCSLITPDIVVLANSFAAKSLYILEKRVCWLDGVSQASVPSAPQDLLYLNPYPVQFFCNCRDAPFKSTVLIDMYACL